MGRCAPNLNPTSADLRLMRSKSEPRRGKPRRQKIKRSASFLREHYLPPEGELSKDVKSAVSLMTLLAVAMLPAN
ncbi:hypothetical protein C8Q75DRAFT_889237 [Abortiporus biennis]|nr:hypothetical protein C8Q75DRAFT_889237 [Abortiporus biennis]